MIRPRITKHFSHIASAMIVALFVFSVMMLGQARVPQSHGETKTIINQNSEIVATNAIVVKVVDGDTIEAILDSEPDKTYKIRLLGVNTPETVDPRKPVECFGKQASDYSKSRLSDQRILLEPDPQADEIDRYGRLLRNIFLSDGTDYNAELVRQGYAYSYTSFPQDPVRKSELRRLESEAKSAERGLWDPEQCPVE